MNEDQLKKISNWLIGKGAEILPNTNEYEVLRFKGSAVGVIYKTGKTSGEYTDNTITCFKKNKKWDGAPVNVGRNNSYKKEKVKLLKRDGDKCFYCDDVLGDDITVEHLIALINGGQNSLSNMVLAHEKCNNTVGNLPVSEKVKIAIKNRINKINHNEHHKFKDVAHLYLGCELYVNAASFHAKEGSNSKSGRPNGAILSPSILADIYEGTFQWKDFTPFLRKIGSHTSKEEDEVIKEYYLKIEKEAHFLPKSLLWWLSKHFDLFGLIESGEALDASNYPNIYKTEK